MYSVILLPCTGAGHQSGTVCSSVAVSFPSGLACWPLLYACWACAVPSQLLYPLEASCARECRAYSGQLRAVQTSQRNKEARVNMLVNRMAASQARAENEVL